MESLPGYKNMVSCPYCMVPILRQRFQTHLVKCKKNHPEIILEKCPFNSTHLFQKTELEDHVKNCDDRANFDLYRFPIAPARLADVEQRSEPEPVFKPLPPSEENWDNQNVEAYNPQAYVERAPVIRQLNVAPKSQKRAFREAERLRLNQFK